MKNFTKIGFTTILTFTLICSLTENAFAQAIKPDLNTVDPVVQGLVCKYKIYVAPGDTAYSELQCSPTANFAFPQNFYLRTSDTTTSYTDTITENMGLAPAPALYYVRVRTISLHGKDTMYSTVDLEMTLEPVGTGKLTIVNMLPNQNGAYFTLNYFSGNSLEKMEITYTYSYDSLNFFPAGTREFVGRKNGYQDSVWGLFSNKDVWIKIHFKNSIGNNDTTIKFRTALTPQKPIITIQKVTAFTDSIKIEFDVVSFNSLTSVLVRWNNNQDSLFVGYINSLKSESLSVTISNLSPEMKIIGIVEAQNNYGKETEQWSETTLSELLMPRLVVPNVFAYPGYAEVNWNWQTNSQNLFTRIDAKVYTDPDENSPAVVKQISNGSNSIIGTTKSNIDLEPGQYWIRLIGETQNSEFIKSELYSFTISFGTGFKENELFFEPIECIIYDFSGKVVCSKYTASPKNTLLKDDNLPKGLLIAVPLNGKIKSFRAYNQ